MLVARWQRITVGVAGLVASALFVALAFRRLDFASVLATCRQARLMPWLPLAVLAYVAGHWTRGQRLRVLVQRDAILHWPTATNVVVVGYASNNVVPARLGELVRAGMLAERTGMPIWQALTITFIERLLDGIAILGLLLVAASTVAVQAGWIGRVAEGAAIVFGAALGAVLLAVLFPSAVLASASRLSARLGSRAHDRILALATSVTSAGASLRRPRTALGIGAYSIAVWLLESLMFAFLLPAFGMRLAIGPSIIAMSVTNLGILLPSSPGFVGSFHYFCAQALMAQGVPGPTAMGYAVVVHLAFFVPVTLWGGGAMLWYGIQVGTTAALARAARSLPQAAIHRGIPVHPIARIVPAQRPSPSPRPSPFDVALAEALLDREGAPPLDRAALGEAAAFLARQLDALPTRLRLLHRAGMAAFRLSVRLTSLRGFCELGVDRRRAIVFAWAFGRVGLCRKLFRPARSTVLLAYYERAVIPLTLSPAPASPPPRTMEQRV